MRSLEDQLTNYARYHRDRRNLATHFVGIPLIFVAVVTLLSRPTLGQLAGFPVTPALPVALAAVGFYFALDLRFGVAMSMVTGLAMLVGGALARAPTATWLAAGLALFVGGWVVQFVGHAFEGRKPAFVDDLIGLLVGPLFVVAEVAFAMGLRTEVRDGIVRGAGPTRAGRHRDEPSGEEP